MITYKCDRCGRSVTDDATYFTVQIAPPRVWAFEDGMVSYKTGLLHFCTNCMGKIYECMNELGRSE